MDSDSSSSEVVHPAVLLDLIPCPKCGDQISSWVAKRGNRAGSRFYKCRRHSVIALFDFRCILSLLHFFRSHRLSERTLLILRSQLGQCSFFEWQPVYVLRLIEAGIALPQPPPAADLQPPSANITPGQNHIPVVHDEMQSAALPPIRKPEPVTELPAAPFGPAAVQLQVVNLLLAVTNLMVSVLLLAAVIATLLKLYSL
jgi:hypothetical protein